MRRQDQLRRFDPIDPVEVGRVSSQPVFTELLETILASPPEPTGPGGSASSLLPLPPRLRQNVRPRRLATSLIVAAGVALIAGSLVFGGRGAGLTGPTTTSWRAATPLVAPAGAAGHARHGAWQLAGQLLSGSWQQSLFGPPPGYLSCPGASSCYVMSGHYPSAMANAPIESESLYRSNDAGLTWSQTPMPQGFTPTSPLACGGTRDCAAGGILHGQPVLLSTRDAGHSFTIEPLPAGVGNLFSLSCPTSKFCAGLAAAGAGQSGQSTVRANATFLTVSGVTSFREHAIVSGDSMQSLVCATARNCTAIGTSNALGQGDLTAGVAASTTDGGRRWQLATLPAGFGVVGSLSQLSCARALDCSVSGIISIRTYNPPQCAALLRSLPAPHAARHSTFTAPGPAVRALARAENAAAASAAAIPAHPKGPTTFSCTSGKHTLISAVASTTNGGLSWSPDPLPANVPLPQLSGLSCPTVNECWAAGSEAAPQRIGKTFNGGSSVLLGTTDGGSTWSKATFSVPAGAPNYDGQSYLSIGSISCPSARVCVALGTAAQGSASTPVYRLMLPGGK